MIDNLAMNFTPFYIMANVRRILSRVYNNRTSNRYLAQEIFAVGGTSANKICIEAGIDPDGFRVRKVNS